ncbi:hypothetical protein IWW51_002727 [Coemansia sp. RSA 2702]|nr:hypothetical protein IWW51_002727 [Coemansia sp. RSA 2702]
MAAGPALASAVRGAGPLPPPQPHYPQANAHEGSPVMRRDPFAPAPNDLTYRGAALRQLERSSGTEPGPAANRKRALTAPSSYDAPLRRRVPYGIGGKMISSTDSLLEDDREDGLAGTGYCTPPERSRHIGNRGSLLGESPVSSLRSSLLARTPMQPPTRTPQASTSHVPPTSSAEDEPSVDVLSGPGSPSMDAALRQSRKRRRSPSQQSPQPTASISPASRRRLDMSPAPDGPDAMFPPIDRDAS